MNNYISKQLKIAINKDIKENDALIKALTKDSEQYGDDNKVKIDRLKDINTKLKDLLK